tara:strand:+ start:10181 stop:10420 length:240 start_codon:yes stop_codon:yes gene_type:complete
MSKDERKNAKSIAQTFKKMDKPMSKGGTGGTFTAAATKAGYPDSPEGRLAFANAVLKDPDASSKMKKKATFYKNIINKD